MRQKVDLKRVFFAAMAKLTAHNSIKAVVFQSSITLVCHVLHRDHTACAANEGALAAILTRELC